MFITENFTKIPDAMIGFAAVMATLLVGITIALFQGNIGEIFSWDKRVLLSGVFSAKLKLPLGMLLLIMPPFFWIIDQHDSWIYLNYIWLACFIAGMILNFLVLRNCYHWAESKRYGKSADRNLKLRTDFLEELPGLTVQEQLLIWRETWLSISMPAEYKEPICKIFFKHLESVSKDQQLVYMLLIDFESLCFNLDENIELNNKAKDSHFSISLKYKRIFLIETFKGLLNLYIKGFGGLSSEPAIRLLTHIVENLNLSNYYTDNVQACFFINIYPLFIDIVFSNLAGLKKDKEKNHCGRLSDIFKVQYHLLMKLKSNDIESNINPGWVNEENEKQVLLLLLPNCCGMFINEIKKIFSSQNGSSELSSENERKLGFLIALLKFYVRYERVNLYFFIKVVFLIFCFEEDNTNYLSALHLRMLSFSEFNVDGRPKSINELIKFLENSYLLLCFFGLNPDLHTIDRFIEEIKNTDFFSQEIVNENNIISYKKTNTDYLDILNALKTQFHSPHPQPCPRKWGGVRN